MDPLQTAATYDRIAPHWEDPNFDRNNGIEALRRAIRFAHGRGAALDIGCGCTGRFIDLLLAEGFDVEGLDLSAEMLARARNRHPDVRFHHADIRTWEFSRPYDLLIGWDSIWHVPLADQIPVLRRLCRGLAPGGLLLLSAGVRQQRPVIDGRNPGDRVRGENLRFKGEIQTGAGRRREHRQPESKTQKPCKTACIPFLNPHIWTVRSGERKEKSSGETAIRLAPRPATG